MELRDKVYLYLHGFASSPRSRKAQTLRSRFAEYGVPLQIPDLNQGDFTHLSLTRQIQQASALLTTADSAIVIGSSFGGLTAAWLTQQQSLQPKLQKLVLLAPAFSFLDHWLPKLGPEQLERWCSEGALSVYHYGEGRSLPLSHAFIQDAQQYSEQQLTQAIPTLILHGLHDQVIPVDASRAYAAQRPWVRLVELDSDHALADVQTEIWQQVKAFLKLKSLA
ncbi:MAG: YqiA/YcfP family alpha/beta fold hydrolase [Cyanobacteria bacterium J06639_16]